jgi:hypothetical protein
MVWSRIHPGNHVRDDFNVSRHVANRSDRWKFELSDFAKMEKCQSSDAWVE